MKVLHVIPSYEPAWAFGGTVTSVSQLCRALARQGVDVTVYTTDADGEGGHLNVPRNEPINLGGARVYYFRCDIGIKKAFYSRGLSKKLKETVKDYDLVHVSALWQWFQLSVYATCKSNSKPYIASTHGSLSPWAWEVSVTKKRLWWHFFGRRSLKNASAIHFTNQEERFKSFIAASLLKEIPSFVVQNGIEVRKQNEFNNIRENLKISDDRFVLLFVGRIHRVKGIHIILDALKKINDKRFLFLIVGHREDKGYAQQLIKLSEGLSDKVIFHDAVPKENVWDFYYSSDLFVLPSYSENFSNVTVEAMACGLPVLISKNVGIWREVESDGTGVVVNQNADEIANILIKLSEDTATLQKMSKNAKKSVENRFKIDHLASLMLKAYEDILMNRKSPELKWK